MFAIQYSCYLSLETKPIGIMSSFCFDFECFTIEYSVVWRERFESICSSRAPTRFVLTFLVLHIYIFKSSMPVIKFFQNSLQSFQEFHGNKLLIILIQPIYHFLKLTIYYLYSTLSQYSF